MGRPAREIDDQVKADIARLARKFGRDAIVDRLGLPEWLVRRCLEALGIRRRRPEPWTGEESEHLREHAGERSVTRLQRDLRAMGHDRSRRAIEMRVRVLTGLGVRELRTELSVAQVCMLIGRSDRFVIDEIGRRRLRAHRSEGEWCVWPSALRSYVLEDLDRVDWLTAERGELQGLLLRRWGVSEEELRRARKARRHE